ncbi:uncharacterized protein LOC105801544 isoform X1 [Gossypium raimondii]|uniref:Uncharacterized protein n=6 Tax=Gossypium TaxID=3633 RepID=A0A0D2P8U5_GOSRA|nr:uncharacterized protein LOC105801544 isoform X1 [Gossypium raimondii]KJB42212.1 hypothetical protein B456_007G225100 [Gossypium raimondii]
MQFQRLAPALKMSKKGSKESKLSRYLKAPIRFLIKAGEFYVKSLTQYSERVGYGTVMGCSTGQLNTFPRSYSVSTTRSGNGDDDLRELIRAASTRSLDNNNRVQLDLVRRQQARQSLKMPRSHSVGIGRIDEDRPCDFDEDIKVNIDYVPRRKSHAVVVFS